MRAGVQSLEEIDDLGCLTDLDGVCVELYYSDNRKSIEKERVAVAGVLEVITGLDTSMRTVSQQDDSEITDGRMAMLLDWDTEVLLRAFKAVLRHVEPDTAELNKRGVVQLVA